MEEAEPSIYLWELHILQDSCSLSPGNINNPFCTHLPLPDAVLPSITEQTVKRALARPWPAGPSFIFCANPARRARAIPPFVLCPPKNGANRPTSFNHALLRTCAHFGWLRFLSATANTVIAPLIPSLHRSFITHFQELVYF